MLCRPFERRAHDVVRVGRAEALGEHVGHAHHLEHRAHRAAGDDAGAFRARAASAPWPRRAGRSPRGAACRSSACTLNILRRASSIAFCTATGTSRALPLPMPMPPSPSPTTVSAAKPSTRPPFTTLVTRLTAIIFSRRPSPRSSLLHPGLDLRHERLSCLELQAALAGRVGQRLHAAVVAEAGAVERDRLDAQLLRLLGDALADQPRPPCGCRRS